MVNNSLQASSGGSFDQAATFLATTLIIGYLLAVAVARLRRSRPDLRVGTPLLVGFGLRIVAILGISVTGLSSTLRGGDETTFLTYAQFLAAHPLGRSFLPHAPYQLQTDVFALEIKLFHLSQSPMRVIQVGIAMLGMILILAAVTELAGGRAARLAAWLFALEPGSIFFNSGLHKEPLMELAAGLVVFGGTRLWTKLDVRGVLICALGGLIAVETRSYAGWFLVAAAVLVLLQASVRGMDRPMRAMPLIYGVIVIAFIAAPTILQASSSKNLQTLQQSQNANSTGAGEGSATGGNGSNLALEEVNYSSRGAILTNLPKRIRDLVLKPYPWQLSDTSQRFGALGTMFVYAVLFFLLRFAILARGRVTSSIGPLLYPLLFMLVAYALSAGNAGTGFRYRTHLVTLVSASVAILWAKAAEAREERKLETALRPKARSRLRGPSTPRVQEI
jgi:hypothetical protein